MAELSKLFQGVEIVEMNRSEMHPSDYNPRIIDAEAKKRLKRSIKKYGVLGGIYVNRQTGNTIVGGHQKVFILDEINKYDEDNPDTDYKLRVALLDVDETREKEINIALNNNAMTGQWDYDKLAELIPSIDYKDVGFDEADLSMIGVDFNFQTEQEASIADAFSALTMEADMKHQQEVQQRAEQRAEQKEAIKAAQDAAKAEQEAMSMIDPADEKTLDEKIAHVKDVKQQVMEAAEKKAADMNAYLMLSFDNYQNKVDFMRNAGYPDDMKFVKGEDFLTRIEFILPE